MSGRVLSPDASPEVTKLLDQLTKHPSVQDYQTIMFELGKSLGSLAHSALPSNSKSLLICTNEDADFLAKGVLDSLHDLGRNSIAVACFWNERRSIKKTGYVAAPIIRQYVEHITDVDSFLVVKSIIASSCVVRTNIEALVHDMKPHKIVVLAPVILKGAEQRLEEQFSKNIAKNFRYIWFAKDTHMDRKGQVVPGIGGSVYKLLGIGTAETKNSYTPNLVKDRRASLTAYQEAV